MGTATRKSTGNKVGSRSKYSMIDFEWDIETWIYCTEKKGKDLLHLFCVPFVVFLDILVSLYFWLLASSAWHEITCTRVAIQATDFIYDWWDEATEYLLVPQLSKDLPQSWSPFSLHLISLMLQYTFMTSLQRICIHPWLTITTSIADHFWRTPQPKDI